MRDRIVWADCAFRTSAMTPVRQIAHPGRAKRTSSGTIKRRRSSINKVAEIPIATMSRVARRRSLELLLAVGAESVSAVGMKTSAESNAQIR